MADATGARLLKGVAVSKAARADIQGLRALAVGLVLVYHLVPARLTGGFVGVDVFFVISGFLIIGSLADEVRRTGRLALPSFYARRIRRLLPAASFVLLATVAATLLFLPVARWPAIMREVVASALNVQNWLLAIFSADYEHATAAASPVQHFWSLSVEEQFYLIIPVILLLSAAAARRGANAARWAFGSVLVITVGSLACSVLMTGVPAGAAYFITPTRLWELGIGGLAAMAIHRVQLGLAWRMLLGWAGIAAVGYSAFAFTTAMAFPGWIALVPTLGTVAILVAGASAPGSPVELGMVLGLQPFRYLGDISYSLYLWHWPVIVFVLERSGATALTPRQVAKVAALSLVLAILTKHAVEDPFRRRKTATVPTVRRPFRLRLRATYLLGAAMVIATLVSATVPWQVAAERRDDLLAATMYLDDAHPGALAFDAQDPKPAPKGVPLLPDPAVVELDRAIALKDNCGVYDLDLHPPAGDACAYGNLAAPKTMVLVGDSHMTMYTTALINHAVATGEWRVKVMTHEGCAYGDLPPDKSGYPLRLCADKAYKVLPALLALKPDLVVTSGFTLGFEVVDGKRSWYGRDQLVEGYRKLLRPLADAGIKLAAIRDVPLMTAHTPRCLQRFLDNPTACDTPRAAALGDEQDPLIEAVSVLPNVTVADMTPWLCRGEVCPAVIGNVIVYRDNHLTDTFVRTLTGPLTKQLGVD